MMKFRTRNILAVALLTLFVLLGAGALMPKSADTNASVTSPPDTFSNTSADYQA